jgi:hypothetical protein
MYEPPNQTIQSFPLQNSSPIKSTGLNGVSTANNVSGGNRESGKLTVINCTGNGTSTSTEQENTGNELVIPEKGELVLRKDHLEVLDRR